MKTENDRVIALAGVFQAAFLVQQIARKGISDTEVAQASIYSLFQLDASSVEAVYNGLPGIKKGLQTLEKQLSGSSQRDMEITRYTIALLQLERKLAKQPKRLAYIADGLTAATNKLEHFGMNHPNILAHLADIYAETISTLKPKIMVQGEPSHLNNPDNVNKIRSLLLAGIRSAMLWRQCGGKRRSIILGRKQLLITSQQLLARL